MREKLWIPYLLEKACRDLGVGDPGEIGFTQHHESHAASAFFPSPFDRSAILTMDGVGEWATTTVGAGEGAEIRLLSEIRFPHSLGLLYSAFTYLAGFKVNSGEYKLMGLAPYGEPRFVDQIKNKIVQINPDGSFRLDLSYFNYLGGLTMTSGRMHRLLGPPRDPESEITRRETDLARSIQVITEEVVLKMTRTAMARAGSRNLCMAGGVALNCVANGHVLRQSGVDKLWIQPAAGDAGGAVGAALYGYHQYKGQARSPRPNGDGMNGAMLGPDFSPQEIAAFLEHGRYPHERPADDNWASAIAERIANGKVVGLFQGRMEFGPRALGNRSIIGDPRSPKMQSIMNLKIKYRESFRPFAPSVLREKVSDVFELEEASPYMLLVAAVRERYEPDVPAPETHDLMVKLNEVRSPIPAVTHVDYSARIQTVDAQVTPRYYAIIKAFETLTGCPLVINTSFNVRGEPLVCTPEDAYRCFMRTEMDTLVLGPYLLEKADQIESEGALAFGPGARDFGPEALD